METNNSSIQSVREGRIQKLTDLIDMGVNPYPYTFDKTANAQTLQKNTKTLKQELKHRIFILLQDALWLSETAECLLI